MMARNKIILVQRQTTWLLAAAAVLCLTAISAADTVTMRGSTIPLRKVQVQSIRAGEVFYLDRNGRPMRRGLDEISQLGFDDLPKLDQAEAALAAGDHDAALRLFLQALLNAKQSVHRLWIHVRLNRVHNIRKEYVPAAGHGAAAMMIEPNAYWRVLEPTCQPVEPTYAQALEADDLLREAARQVSDGMLAKVIERMRVVVRPIRLRLEKQYNGPSIARGSTWSGFARKSIADGTILHGKEDTDSAEGDKGQQSGDRDQPNTVKPGGEQTSPAPATDPTTPRVRPASPPSRVVDTAKVDQAAEAIDELLEADQFAEALNLCEAAGQNAGDRDVARLLHQWGRALVGVNRGRDAAIMYTRCAVLFSGTEHGLESLIETAKLYQTEFKRPVTRRRLLMHAIELAELQGRETLRDRARQMLRDSSRK